VIYCSRAVLDGMIENNNGTIINIASDAGRGGSSGETIYAGAKGAVISFTKSLAREVARYNINVNCLCPGPTNTPMFHGQPEKIKESLQ
jgi:2-hydroxycyclohexanecarboxyl-CoA dehydrogenase